MGMLAGSLVVSHISTKLATWTSLILLLAIHLGTNYLAVRPDRHPGHLRGQLARRPARGPDRRAVDVQPEPEVHGVRALGACGHPAHAAARRGRDRARRRQRRAQAQLLGDD